VSAYMKPRIRKFGFALGVGLIVTLSGCADNFERWHDNQPPKQLKVEQVHYSHDVNFAAGDDRLAVSERERLDSFLAHAQVGSTDKVYVNLEPDGERVTERRVSTVAAFLKLRGLKPASPTTGFAEGKAKDNTIQVVVRRYLVTLPGCPDWTSDTSDTFNNDVHSNYGCATVSNLGMMVADPEDLVRGRTLSPADGDYLRTSIVNYRTGKTKPLLDPKSSSGSAEPTMESSDGGGDGG